MRKSLEIKKRAINEAVSEKETEEMRTTERKYE